MDRIPVVEVSHERVADVVSEGDFVIDATAGNGGDTEFLARVVGSNGFVLALDIQSEAVEATTIRLRDAGLINRCAVVVCDHAELVAAAMKHAAGRPAKAVMFNLGFLPGGAREIATVATSTVAALGAAVAILEPAGIVSIVVYRGHEGARDEAAAVEHWLAKLDRSNFEIEWLGRDGVPGHRPYAVFVSRR